MQAEVRSTRRRPAMVFIAAVVALCSASLTGAEAAAGVAAGARAGVSSWATGLQVPGSAELSLGWIDSVSCAAAGNCSAGGVYVDQDFRSRAAVANEVNGVWGQFQRVDGLPAEPGQANASTNSVSCASAGNCSAGGITKLLMTATRSLSTRRTAAGAGRSRSPAWPVSARARMARSFRCRAARRASAPRPGTTTPPAHGTVPAASRHSLSASGTAPGAGRNRSPASPASTQAATPRSPRCRAARRATALRAGTTSPRAVRRRLSSASGTPPGAARRKSPAWPASAQAGMPRSPRCRAARRATAPRAGTTSPRAASRRSSSPSGTPPGAGRRKSRPGPPQQGPRCPGQLGVVRLGGQLRRRRVLLCRLRESAGVRRHPAARQLGPGGAGPRHSPPQNRGFWPDHLGVVRLGGQLQRCRELRLLEGRAAVRGQRKERPVGPRRGSLWHVGPQRGPRRDRVGVLRIGGQLHRRRVVRARLLGGWLPACRRPEQRHLGQRPDASASTMRLTSAIILTSVRSALQSAAARLPPGPTCIFVALNAPRGRVGRALLRPPAARRPR